MDTAQRELSVREVNFSITKEEIESLKASGHSEIIGQPRAVKALKMGIEIRAKGYNVFVSGLSGTGKRTAIFRMLGQYKPEDLQLKDIVIVNNFEKPNNPRVLYFPAGEGAGFKKRIQLLVEGIRERVRDRIGSEALTADGDEFTNEPITIDISKEMGEILGEAQKRIDELRETYTDESTLRYVEELWDDITQNLILFLQEENAKDETGNPIFTRYGVNILVDHSRTTSVPIVFEKHPTYANLFGTMETLLESAGEARTSFMMIRPGSLIQASGGFLILQAEDIIDEDESWNSLKLAIRDSKVEIQVQPGLLNAPTPHLKPEAVEIDVKVIMMGNDQMYDILYSLDEDFQKLFKIPAEFDSVMERNQQTTAEYVAFMRRIVEDEGLRKLDHSGIAAVVEYGIRLSERKDQLSTRFSLIADIIREADYWAGKLGRTDISREAVEEAIENKTYLFNMPEDKIDEQILSGELLISVTGKAVGKVNGLAILDRGYYAFGRPALITSRVAPGSGGIINIEHESGLSGEIHDKGILIIEGFLRSRYAKNVPLSITASICFEQSYMEVDGDSAASAEAYVLLSAIAELPLRQDIAVTGSFNQMGEIQPIGGVTEKVEGFYTVCKKLGLSGTQGVIIPIQNVDSLVLNREIQKAIGDGKFHLYPVSTVDEGMEILTGMRAGEMNAKGNFPLNSINHLVEKRLRELAGQVKVYGGS